MMPRMEKVLQILWEQSRFASYFYQSVQFQEEKKIPTLALHVTGHRLSLLFNPEFPDKIIPEELIGLLIHEMMHIVLNHDHRSLPHHDPALRNLAQDMVVNSYLMDQKEMFFSRMHQGRRDHPDLLLPAGLPRIPGAFFHECCAGKKQDTTWENLYNWLVKKKKKHATDRAEEADWEAYRLNPFFLSGMAADGIMETGPEGLSFHHPEMENLPTGVHLFGNSADRTSVEALKNRMIRYASRDEDCRDERFFQSIAGMIQQIRPTGKSFSLKTLKAFLESTSMSEEWDYTASRFDRRYFASGLYAPGRTYRKKMTVTIAVDVSGSMVMHPENLEAAFGVVESLLNQYKVFLLCIDETVFVPFRQNDTLQKIRETGTNYLYRKGDWRHIRTGSSGTTFFSPLFDSFLKGHHEPLVVITDGDIFDLDRLKPYPQTLWVIPREKEKPFHPLFGKVMMMKTVTNGNP
ncbi:MAG: hypothetical protein ABIK15_09515 [Pseudomonadota bacterium]